MNDHVNWYCVRKDSCNIPTKNNEHDLLGRIIHKLVFYSILYSMKLV